MTTLETKTPQQRLVPIDLHASLLKIMLACSKKYTTTYYCKCAVWKLCDSVPDFVLLQSCATTESLGSRLVIMPTSHECIFCCEGERVVN